MEEGILYNGKKFPDYIFSNNVVRYLFLEFDFIFDEEFWNLFKDLLENSNITKIAIENLEPKLYVFNEEINVRNLPKSFKESARIAKPQNYINADMSFYMLTELALIYASESKQTFCIYLDRRYWIAILAFSKKENLDFFDRFAIKDINDYLEMSFSENNVPTSFKEIVYKNWHLFSRTNPRK